jgi:hypothetical protein
MVIEGLSEEFFDKYSWNFLKYISSAFMYTFGCLTSKRPATGSRGKVGKDVLAIPVVLLDTDMANRTIVSESQTVCATCDSAVADRVLH